MAEKWEIQRTVNSFRICDQSWTNDKGHIAVVGNAYTIDGAHLFASSRKMLVTLENTLAWMRDDLGLDDDSPEVAPVIAAIKAAEGE